MSTPGEPPARSLFGARDRGAIANMDQRTVGLGHGGRRDKTGRIEDWAQSAAIGCPYAATR